MDVLIGRNSVLEALRAGRPITRILLHRNADADPRLAQIVKLADIEQIPHEIVSGAVLDSKSRGGVHQGVVAFAATLSSLTLDELPTLSAKQGEPGLYVVLDGIEDPHNLGAILRTSEAAGVHGVVVRSRRAVGLSPAVVKAAAGAAEYIPLIEVTNIARAVETLKENGIWVVGVEGSAKQSYLEVDYKPATAVVIGAEGRGISYLVRQKCDLLAAIPMKGKISSLNASVAAGVVLYEVVRQRS
jgi:23S rRNA (guanosine2251-2'-O)-methyltransferase